MSNESARQLAIDAFAGIKVVPTSLITYRSAGMVIAIGEQQQLELCDQLPEGISIQRIASGAAGLRIEVSGHLGAFEIRIEDGQGKISTHKADAVLDLHQTALLQRDMLPPGYFHLTADSWDAVALGEELQELAGEFEKPRYFEYDASICAHGVNGKIACRQCIDACPAEAITSLVERIQVDPFLCQGGGSCAAVCPSGAITYAYPGIRDQGKRLKKMLQVYHAEGGRQAMVLFHPQSVSVEDYCATHDNLLAIEVEELGSVGMELCLSALAYGASQVLLLVDDQVAPLSRKQMEAQLDWVKALITGLGLDPARISSFSNPDAIPACDATQVIEAAIHDMPDDKRNAIFQALDHIVNCLKPAQPVVDLPRPAPFGEAVIDAQKCTLCMACVGACPGRALQDGSNRAVPEVFFLENKCLQCNACVLTCPEDAIVLKPRMLFDHELRNRARSLNSDTPFACIGCGKPFAPTSVIAKMQDKLKDHYMFANQRALDRLKMCEDCRVVDIVDDPEALGGQFDALRNFRD